MVSEDTINSVAQNVIQDKEITLEDIIVTENHIYIQNVIDLRGGCARLIYKMIPKRINKQAWIIYQVHKLNML